MIPGEIRRRAVQFTAATVVMLTGFFWSNLVAAAEFSADMTQEFGKMTMKGKYHMKGENIRSDMEMMGQTRTTIVRKDKSVVWILIPKRQQYMELPFSEEAKNNPQFYQDKLESVATKKDLGSEDVNGYTCRKYLYTFNDTSRGTMTQWFSEELQFPVKMVNKGSNWEMTTEFSNIRKGGVDASLFEIPQGYTKMEKPAGMPGMMPPPSGRPGPAAPPPPPSSGN